MQAHFAHPMAPKRIRKSKPQPRVVDARNRVALSPEAMKVLGVEAGDYVVFEEREGEVVVRRVDWTVKRR